MKATNIRLTKNQSGSFILIAKGASGKELCTSNESLSFTDAKALLLKSKGKVLRKPTWIEYVAPVPQPKKPYVKRAPTKMTQQEADQYANCF
jgi:hypothetical protein